MKVDSITQYKLPLRVTREDLENLPPLEKVFALHLIEKYPGQIFEVKESV